MSHIFNSVQNNIEKHVAVEITLFSHLRRTNNPVSHILTLLSIQEKDFNNSRVSFQPPYGSSDDFEK